VLPIGGYTGSSPEPTVPALEAKVDAGDFHLFLAAAKTDDPRVVWIAHHCFHVHVAIPHAVSPFALYYCTPPR
jgi:hypothetical protein